MNRLMIFIIGTSILGCMHILSTMIGATFPYLLSHTMTELICIVLFLGFGFYLIYDSIFEEEHNVLTFKLRLL